MGLTKVTYSMIEGAPINVLDFGAVGDGTTDDTAAITAMFTYAATLDNPVLYFPAGTYLVKSSAAVQYTLTDNMTITGDGMDASIIQWNATNSGSTICLFGTAEVSTPISNVTIKNIAIRGDHDTSGYVANSSYPILVYNCTGLTIDSIKVTYSRIMGIVSRACFDVTVTNCVVQYCARDGINTSDCNYVVITNNRIEFCDDDSIAGHTDIKNVADRGYVVSGNIIRFCQGIKLLGARSATVTGNTLEYCMGQGISIQSQDQATANGEGVTAQMGVTIVGNTIKNNFDRQYVDGLNVGAPYISLVCNSAQAGTLPVIPGRPNTGTGTITSPYPYYYTVNNSTVTQPVADGINVIISGNNFVRDMYPTTHISDYGFGEFYTRTGPVDPAVVAAAYLTEGVYIGGRFNNLIVSNNTFSGIKNGLSLTPTAQLVNSTFNNNIVYDCSFGVSVNSSNTSYQDLTISENIFDIDPYLANSHRGSNGTWADVNGPVGILIQNSFGYTIVRNTFKNVCRASDKDFSSIAEAYTGTIQMSDVNYFECQPVATSLGFSTSNKGIGYLQPGNVCVYKIVDSDPTSATYGKTLNSCPIVGNSIPTSGTWVAGHVVKYAGVPTVLGGAGNQYTINGWIRVTTGSGNVSNTDWYQTRTLTGT